MEKSQQNILDVIKEIVTREKRIVNFLGHKIIINKNVFPADSQFSFSSKITAKKIPKNPGIVLDVGTGTGVQAIIAIKRGAKKVVAVDIDGDAVKNAKENVKFYKMEKSIEVRKGYLLDCINNDEKFDLIISNLPFADVKSKDNFAHFLFDAGLKLHERLLKESKQYLAKEGKILISTGTVGNEKKLNELIKKYNYRIMNIKEEEFNNLIWKVYTLKLR